jgi:hypothetical protein
MTAPHKSSEVPGGSVPVVENFSTMTGHLLANQQPISSERRENYTWILLLSSLDVHQPFCMLVQHFYIWLQTRSLNI